MRRCIKCHRVKLLKYFVKNVRLKTGRENRCKACHRKRVLIYSRKNTAFITLVKRNFLQKTKIIRKTKFGKVRIEILK